MRHPDTLVELSLVVIADGRHSISMLFYSFNEIFFSRFFL